MVPCLLLWESSKFSSANGQKILKLFCRAAGNIKIATSYDGGVTWGTPVTDSTIQNPYCQLSAIKYPYPVPGYAGKEMVMVSSCRDKSVRKNGAVYLGYYDAALDKLVWVHYRVITPTEYMYSSLAVQQNGKIHLLYEVSNKKTIYTSFVIDYLLP